CRSLAGEPGPLARVNTTDPIPAAVTSATHLPNHKITKRKHERHKLPRFETRGSRILPHDKPRHRCRRCTGRNGQGNRRGSLVSHLDGSGPSVPEDGRKSACRVAKYERISTAGQGVIGISLCA